MRPLGNSENFNLNFQFTNCFIVESTVDFNAKQDLVHTAIADWKLTNQILKSKISAEPPMNYFEIADESSVKKNVFFMFTKCGSDPSDSWKMLASIDAFEAFEHEHGLLWRLTFLKLVFLNKVKLIYSYKL